MTRKRGKPTGNEPVRNRLKVAGKRLWFNGEKVDGTQPIARTFKNHMEELAEQLGGELTPAQNILARRASMIATLADIDDAMIATGQDVDAELYLKRTNSLVGLLTKLGLARVPRDVTPNPRDRSKPKPMDSHTRALIDQADD